MKDKQATYFFLYHALLGPYFGVAFFVILSLVPSFSTGDFSLQRHPADGYAIALFGVSWMTTLSLYLPIVFTSLCCGVYRTICFAKNRNLNLTLYYLIALTSGLILAGEKSAVDVLLHVATSIFLAHCLRFLPQKRQPEGGTSFVMDCFPAGIAFLGLSILFIFLLGTLCFLPSIFFKNSLVVSMGGVSLFYFFAAFAWLPGLYLAHSASNNSPIDHRRYHIYAALSAVLFPTLFTFFCLRADPSLIWTGLMIILAMLIISTRFASFFLALMQRKLSNTPFALQFAKKSPPVSATEN